MAILSPDELEAHRLARKRHDEKMAHLPKVAPGFQEAAQAAKLKRSQEETARVAAKAAFDAANAAKAQASTVETAKSPVATKPAAKSDVVVMGATAPILTERRSGSEISKEIFRANTVDVKSSVVRRVKGEASPEAKTVETAKSPVKTDKGEASPKLGQVRPLAVFIGHSPIKINGSVHTAAEQAKDRGLTDYRQEPTKWAAKIGAKLRAERKAAREAAKSRQGAAYAAALAANPERAASLPETIEASEARKWSLSGTCSVKSGGAGADGTKGFFLGGARPRSGC